MKNAIKGMLLSGLVLPGLGQVILKSYKRGIALMLLVLIAFITIVVSAARQAIVVLEKVESQGGGVDMESISQAATQAAVTADHLLYNIALLAVIVCWLVGMVDAYTTGKKIDRGEQL
ncbi:MAG: hypothetical protein GY697_16395 [Desulfobacterales bacterium]|nr:hypothetical protein [Desulfobacterales bacterium]